MSIRKWFHGKATGVAGLGVPADRVFSPGAVGAAEPGDAPARPFIVNRLSPANPGVGPIVQQVMACWVHDDPGTMNNIDNTVKALKKGLDRIGPEAFEGMMILECRWIGTSADTYDDGHKTNVVFVEFQLTWKPAP